MNKLLYIKPLHVCIYYDYGAIDIIHKEWRASFMFPPAFFFIAKYRHFHLDWNIYKRLWFTFYMDKK